MQPNLDAFITIEKYLLHAQGVLPNRVMRGPLGYCLDVSTAKEVDRLFARLQRACGRRVAKTQG
jgi:hypothetical protein